MQVFCWILFWYHPSSPLFCNVSFWKQKFEKFGWVFWCILFVCFCFFLCVYMCVCVWYQRDRAFVNKICKSETTWNNFVPNCVGHRWTQVFQDYWHPHIIDVGVACCQTLSCIPISWTNKILLGSQGRRVGFIYLIRTNYYSIAVSLQDKTLCLNSLPLQKVTFHKDSLFKHLHG